jgi:hypothetical protein
MSARKPKYRITPSLLSKWSDLLNADRDWESFYGDADEPSVSPEDFYAKREQELLDAINRVPFTSEAASRGTALNELVDCIVEHRKPKEGVSIIKIMRDEPDDGRYIKSFIVTADGFTFYFDAEMVFQIWRKFRNAICQHRCEAVMETQFGPVSLYGDADYIHRDIVYDLKSTSRYDRYGKFAEGWQKDLYPWALIESGEMDSVSGFEYAIVPLTGGNASNPVYSGELKVEYYPYDHNASTGRLLAAVEPFIMWIEEHRDMIVHPRIFNKE